MRRLFLPLLFLLIGCGPSARKMTRINLGMTKAEVIQTIGQPVSVSAIEGVEYLNYRLTEESEGYYGAFAYPYFVRIKNGIVDAYGRLGDFDSTKPNRSQVDLNINK